LDKEKYQLYVNYSLRVLLGDSKGQMILYDLEKEAPETYKMIATEAKEMYDRLTAEERLNPVNTLTTLMKEGIQLQFEIIKKRLEQTID
jgi:ABC-type Na+ transport system ATPase subunit NatA